MECDGHNELNPDFTTCDPKIQKFLSVVDRVANSKATILIEGESGTGKEIVAKRVHARSSRALKRLISINCGALQENLLVTELFGYQKGAFTGAAADKPGLVELAHGGTLFLDEIGEMSLSVQAMLLRFLQEGEIYRVGARESISLDVRLVCATNRKLSRQVEEGLFRRDLFYRINTISLKVPALRSRRQDIPLLLQTFFDEFNSNAPKELEERALQALVQYPWPGNVRELKNLALQLSILTETRTIHWTDLPTHIRTPNRSQTVPSPSSLRLAEVERHHILNVLENFDGNKTRAAQAMGITVKTLYNKLAKYRRPDLALSTD